MTRPRQCLLGLLIWGVDGLADEIVRLCENKPKERDGVKKRDAPRAQGRKQKRRYHQHTAKSKRRRQTATRGKAEWLAPMGYTKQSHKRHCVRTRARGGLHHDHDESKTKCKHCDAMVVADSFLNGIQRRAMRSLLACCPTRLQQKMGEASEKAKQHKAACPR